MEFFSFFGKLYKKPFIDSWVFVTADGDSVQTSLLEMDLHWF